MRLEIELRCILFPLTILEMIEQGNQEADGHSDRAPEFPCGDGRNFQKDNHLYSTKSGLYGRLASRKPLINKKAREIPLGVCQKGT